MKPNWIVDWWKVLALVLFAIVMTGAALAAPPSVYLCTTDQLVGFRVSNGQWRQTSFAPDAYILKKATDAVGISEKRWELSEHGREGTVGVCYETWPILNDKGQSEMSRISCNGIFKIELDKKTLRLLYAYFAGYNDGLDTNADTPSIGIGKCSPI